MPIFSADMLRSMSGNRQVRNSLPQRPRGQQVLPQQLMPQRPMGQPPTMQQPMPERPMMQQPMPQQPMASPTQMLSPEQAYANQQRLGGYDIQAQVAQLDREFSQNPIRQQMSSLEQQLRQEQAQGGFNPNSPVLQQYNSLQAQLRSDPQVMAMNDRRQQLAFQANQLSNQGVSAGGGIGSLMGQPVQQPNSALSMYQQQVNQQQPSPNMNSLRSQGEALGQQYQTGLLEALRGAGLNPNDPNQQAQVNTFVSQYERNSPVVAQMRGIQSQMQGPQAMLGQGQQGAPEPASQAPATTGQRPAPYSPFTTPTPRLSALSQSNFGSQVGFSPQSFSNPTNNSSPLSFPSSQAGGAANPFSNTGNASGGTGNTSGGSGRLF